MKSCKINFEKMRCTRKYMKGDNWMKKSIILFFVGVLLFVLAGAMLLVFNTYIIPENDASDSGNKTPTIGFETTPEVEIELNARAVWQDPSNIAVVWNVNKNCSYKVFRSSTRDGEYVCLGESENGSYRDGTVKHPDTYFYKVETKNILTNKVELSEPFEAVISPEEVSSVSVIMYHNFVSEEDIASGVEFEEYSISPASFEEDLIWLKNNGYVTITSAELLTFLEKKEPVPKKAVIISIDDGSWGVYKNAWPLLQKHGMKADLNVIGAEIDSAWDNVHNGGSRVGESAPYCVWEELIEMEKSGVINVCSHTYGLHVYDKEHRVGMSMMENETADSFAEVVKADFALAVKCMEGWIGKIPETVAYPYSKRSIESDSLVLQNTGYKLLMAGEGARGTAGNYFVRGCDISDQLMLMSRPCRMDGTPISTYLERIETKDSGNGVNIQAEQ